MITGFEKHTYNLNADEYDAANAIALLFKKGKANSIKSNSIQTILEKTTKYSYSLARIRKIINYIRRERLVSGLCASQKGYFVASNPDEHLNYIESLRERRDAIDAVYKAALDDFNQTSKQKEIFK